MGLLFKSSKALRDNELKILSYQYGGSVPFYASYTYKQAQQAPYNPSMLLAKYQGAAQPQSTTATSGGFKTVEEKPDGLTNDVQKYMDEVTGLEYELQNGLMENPDFLNTRAGQMLLTRYNNYSTQELVKLKNSKEEFNQAQKNMYSNGSQNNWMFQNGRGLAGTMVKQLDGSYEAQYEWITPDRLNSELNEDGSRKWEAISYKMATDLRGTSMDGNFLQNENFARDLSYGLGVNKVITDILDPFYSDIGYEKSGQESKVGGQIIDNMIIKEAAESWSSSANTNELKSAFDNILQSIRYTPAWDTLYSNAWLTSRNEEEAQNKVYEFLARDMAKRLKIEFDESKTQITDLDAMGMTAGTSSGGGIKTLSKYLDAWSGQTDSEMMELEIPESNIKDDMLKYDSSSTVTSFTVWDDPHSTQLIKTNTILSKNTDFNKVGIMDNAQLPDGTKLKDVEFVMDPGAGSANSTFKGLDAVMPTTGNVKVTVLPIDVNTGAVVNIFNEDVTAMNQKINDIEDRRANDRMAIEGSKEANAKYDAEIEKVKTEHLSKYEGQVVLEKFYIMDVIYNKQSAPEGSWLTEHSKEPSGEEVESYMSLFADHLDEWEWYNPWELSGITDTSDDSGDFGKTTIMIPARNAISLQRADPEATVYTEQYNVMSGTLGSQPGNQPVQVTQDALYEAIKGRSYGTNPYTGETIYQTLYMTDALNK
jgi:hypothetical protein